MWTVTTSPIGDLRVVGTPDGIAMIQFAADPSEHPARFPEPTGAPVGERCDDDPLLAEAVAQLQAYFARELRDFDLPLAPVGTDFQQRVWAELLRIGYGRTATYGEVAKRLGMVPGASRAVGLANGRNPIPVVVPCHRVIGADGTLTGYAGGMERKQILLDLEQDALF